MTSQPPSDYRVVGRYALYNEVASGGMATIHIGRLLGPVGFARTVAIKRMHPQFAKDPEYVSMFLDEARLAARIRHPNVIGTQDVVALSGELFLVMDYVHGETFARLMRACREKNLPIPRSVVSTIMVGVLDGLHAAHEAKSDRGDPLGIVHRDVSPQNIMVGVDGIPRVLDFGIAKATESSRSTLDGQFKGKLRYVPPEQFHGAATRVSDVYAAAVVLWEAFTGRRLFEAKSDAETLAMVLAPKVVPPSRYVPSLPAEAERVVMRGLSVDPARRYPTAREMARALSHALPTANAHDVSEWVQSVAGEAMARRAEQVADIERSTPGPGDVFLRDPRMVSQPPRESAPASEPSPPPVTSPTSSASHGADPGEATVGPPRRRHATARVAALAVGGAVLVASLTLLVARSRPTHLQEQPSDRAAAAAGGGVPQAPPTATATAPSVPAPSASTIAIPTPAAVAPSTSAATAPARPPPPVVRPVHRTAPAPAPIEHREDLDHVIDSRK
jgi:eukaryotic-like serine/threonine-protein kinase